MNSEQQIYNLTQKLSKHCGGKDISVVIGANLNMIMTAAQIIPDPKIRQGLAIMFRNIASQLDSQNGAKQ